MFLFKVYILSGTFTGLHLFISNSDFEFSVKLLASFIIYSLKVAKELLIKCYIFNRKHNFSDTKGDYICIVTAVSIDLEFVISRTRK